MAAPFNAYHKWLAIPLEEQPPHHYRLLGTKIFESDLDVIESAADQRMAHLRTFQGGKHAALSQELLNEISAAKICLLDPQRRGAYDRQLRETLDAAKRAAASATPAQAISASLPPLDLPSASILPAAIESLRSYSQAPLAIQTSGRRHKGLSSQSRTMAIAVTALAVAAVLAGAIIWLNLPDRNAAPVAATANNQASAAKPPGFTPKPVNRPPPAPPPVALEPLAPAFEPAQPSSAPAERPIPPPVPPAVAAPASAEPTPATAAVSTPAQRGFLVANFKGELEVFLNGQRLALATNQQPLPVSLRPADILVIRLSSTFVYRGLRLAFVADRGGTAVLFQRQHFRRIDGLAADQIAAAEVERGGEQPSAGRADDAHQKRWAELQIPADDSEWMSGPEKDTPFQYACVIRPEMFRTIDTAATLAYLRQTWPAEAGLAATESPQPAGRESNFVQVCRRLQGKQNPLGLVASARPFQAPRGDGRRGANGFTITAADRWKTEGTRWRFRYSREGTAWGFQAVHPFQGGHALIYVNDDAFLTAGGSWHAGGWRPGPNKVSLTKSEAGRSLLPMPRSAKCDVESRLSADGRYELLLNEQLVASAQLADVAPLDFSGPAIGTAAFQGADMPRALAPGEAALIVGPLDNGSNVLSEVFFGPHRVE